MLLQKQRQYCYANQKIFFDNNWLISRIIRIFTADNSMKCIISSLTFLLPAPYPLLHPILDILLVFLFSASYARFAQSSLTETNFCFLVPKLGFHLLVSGTTGLKPKGIKQSFLFSASFLYARMFLCFLPMENCCSKERILAAPDFQARNNT